jgi:hypothetical protein
LVLGASIPQFCHFGYTIIKFVSQSAFTIQLTDSDGKQFTFTGTFVSNTQASGTLQVKGPTNSCGAIDAKSTWTAQIAPAASSDTTTSPSATVPQFASDADVVRAFFDALNAKDVDAALALVDDNLIYTFGSTNGIGTDDLGVYLNSQVSRGATYQLSNVQAKVASVEFTVKVGATSFKGSAMFQDGKIVILKLD